MQVLNYMNTKQITKDLQKFDWQFIINFGNSLGELNDSQFRFMKGFVMETTLNVLDPMMNVVRQIHKDFDWETHDIGVELKTLFSQKLYNKNGSIQKNTNIQFTNSNGSNTKSSLDPNEIADITIGITQNGSFFVPKKTVINNLVKKGDGFLLKLPHDQIIPISGPLSVTQTYYFPWKQKLDDLCREAVEEAKKSYDEFYKNSRSVKR